MKKKIFVTGGSGYLGRHLIKYLKSKNYKIFSPTSKEVNLKNFNQLKKIKNNFDQVYHLAAWTQAGDFCLKYPMDQWIINQEINSNIIKWWSNSQNTKSKIVIIGTSCCYDEIGNFEEKNYLNEKPHSSLATYAMTKKMLLQGVISCQLQKKLNWNCFIPSTLYGNGYKITNKTPHFIFDLVRKILRGKYYGDKVELWGDGNQTREIIHVNDFIKNMVNISKTKNNTVLNIGGGSEYSIKFFAKKICKIADYDFNKIHFNKSKYVGAKSKKLSIKKILKIYPNYKKNLTNINKGISDMVKWHIKNKNF